MEYQMTMLEARIQSIYERLNIHTPNHLSDFFEVADKIGARLFFAVVGSRLLEYGGRHNIFLDKRKSRQELWEDLGHELGHFFRDCGNQMTQSKVDIQHSEAKARNFSLQFCVPTFLLLDQQLSTSRGQAIAEVADIFGVTDAFAAARLDHYEKQWQGVYFHHALVRTWKAAEESKSYIKRRG